MLDRTVGGDPVGAEGGMRSCGVLSDGFKIPKCTSHLGFGLAGIWFNAAVEPEGEDSVLLTQVRADWRDARARIRQESGATPTKYTTESDVTHNHSIRGRTDVMVGKKRSKGWQGVTYNLEAGYRALLLALLL